MVIVWSLERDHQEVYVCVCECASDCMQKVLFTIHLEYYRVSSSSQNVGFSMSSSVVFSIELNLKV